jgi:hypothetical protein
LTDAQFRTQADSLCAAANKDTQSFAASITQTSTDAEVTAAIRKTVTRTTRLVDDIANLNAPADMTTDIASMLASVRAGLAQLAKVTSISDLMSTDVTKGPYAQADQAANALGLKTCGKG